jgi:hypothetical protein
MMTIEDLLKTAKNDDLEKEILESPTCRRLVYEILSLASTRDEVDAIRDVAFAAAILAGRYNRKLGKPC